MTIFLLCVGWYLSGFVAACLTLLYQNHSLEKIYGSEVSFTVGDLLMACLLAFGGLVTAAAACIIGLVVLICRAIDTIVGFDTPLFTKKRKR